MTVSEYNDCDCFRYAEENDGIVKVSKITKDGIVTKPEDSIETDIDLIYTGQKQKKYTKMGILNNFLRTICENDTRGSVCLIVTDPKHMQSKVMGWYEGVKWDRNGPQEHPYRFHFKRL